jgi:hypothetical protein
MALSPVAGLRGVARRFHAFGCMAGELGKALRKAAISGWCGAGLFAGEDDARTGRP